MATQWDTRASLILEGRLPIHGTVSNCLEVWRIASAEDQSTAALLVEAAIAPIPGTKRAFAFKGPALRELGDALAQGGRAKAERVSVGGLWDPSANPTADRVPNPFSWRERQVRRSDKRYGRR
jgi:hypothetical protein